MGAKVQSKSFFPGSMVDLNNSFHNGVWDLYHDDKSHKISSPGNSQHYNCFFMTQAMDGYTGYAKEQIKQTILKHESVFRHQLQELHRLYEKQRDLMNPVATEKSNLGFLSQLPSDVSNKSCIFASSFPMVDSGFSRASTSRTDNMCSHIDSIKGKSTLKDCGPLISKFDVSETRVIDLELPAEKVLNFADLNEPIQVEETAFSAFFSNKNTTNFLPQKQDSSAKRTIFGVEIDKRDHTPSFPSSNRQLGAINCDSSFLLPWGNANSSIQNASTLHHNHWLNSSNSAIQNPAFSAGLDSVSDNLEDICAREKHTFLNTWKNRETPEQKLPSWLTAKPCLTEKPPIHHINLDSLQKHSQQFFKKPKINDTQSITKILGVPIIDTKVESHNESNEKKNCGSDTKHHIDLNLSLDEEDGETPSFPESIVKIAAMEIDLKAPTVLKSDTDDGSLDNTHLELVKIAAETIVSISYCPPSTDTLLWFADVITSNYCKESVPKGMDYFEYMTLNLEENHENYKPMIVEEQKEDEIVSSSRRTTRKGQGKRGRQKKDFQKDILPSIVSLSRREITEDIQIFEEAFSATGVNWQTSLSKRKAAARNIRGRRRSVVPEPSGKPPPAAVVAAAALEKSFGGWGRRTRRLPRQRCGNNHRSLALKC